MASQREQIVAALMASLTTPPSGVTKPTGLAVHRNALRPLDSDRLPALVVYSMDCKPSRDQSISSVSQDRLLEYLLTVRIECRVTGEPTDQLLDPLIQFARLVIFTDPSLGGLAYAVRESGILFDGVAKERVFGAAAVDFELSFFENVVPLSDPVMGGNLIEADYPTTIPPNHTSTLIVSHP